MPPRFFVDSALACATDLQLPDTVVRHVQVLRLQAGDAITLFDGRGGSHAATLVDMGKRHALARVGDRNETECEAPFRVTLAQGLAGGDKMDWLIEKAVELGVAAVQPLQAARSVVRLSGERAQKRHAHWAALIQAACEQCGRNRLPVLAPVANLDTWLPASGRHDGQAGAESDLRLLVSPRASESLVAVTSARRDAIAAHGVTLLIGPEGGLSPEEEALALHSGFTPVTLGPRILRTETAGLACLATLNALLGGF